MTGSVGELTITSDNDFDGVEILLDVDYQRYSVGQEQVAEIILYTITPQYHRNRYRIRGFLPYIYVECTDQQLYDLMAEYAQLDEWYVEHVELTKTKYKQGESVDVIKVIGKQPWLVPSIRDLFRRHDIEYHEADIPFTHRFMIDFQLKGLKGLEVTSKSVRSTSDEIDLRVCSLDIEIASPETVTSFDKLIDEADYRITGIGLAWNKDGELETKEFVLPEDDDQQEIELINNTFDFLYDQVRPHVVVTYNGDKFDIPYLLNRFKVLGLTPDRLTPYDGTQPVPPMYGNGYKIPGLLLFDLFSRTLWIYTSDGRKTLDSVAEKLLGVGKVTIDTSHVQLWRESLGQERSQFREYLRRDIILTQRLWSAMNMEEWVEVIKISGGPPGDAIYFTERQSGEFLVYQIMFQRGILIPPAPSTQERKHRKKHRKSALGGLVLDPTRDMATSVIIADFNSMYPSIIKAHNIGGESFKGTEYPLADRFEPRPPTSMAIMQTQMLSRRKLVKDQLRSDKISAEQRKRLEAHSFALKLTANSTFGSYNYIGSRFYDTDIASTITAIGRDYLEKLSDRATAFGQGYETIYGDTDSVFIETPLDEEVQALWKLPAAQSGNYLDHVPQIGELMQYLTRHLPQELQLELEDIAYRIIFHRGAKKRYAYVSALTKEISILGFESVRHDWSPIAKKVQQVAFENLLRTGDYQLTKEKVLEIIHQHIDLKSNTLKEDLITLGPIKRDPDEYKSPTPAIGAFNHYMHTVGKNPEDEWKEIDYFPFLIMKGDSAQWERARHPDLVKPEEIDLIHYMEEALRTVNRFNLNITLDEARGIKYLDLREFFESYKQSQN